MEKEYRRRTPRDKIAPVFNHDSGESVTSARRQTDGRRFDGRAILRQQATAEKGTDLFSPENKSVPFSLFS
jgi:hypothetical protein